MNNPTKKCFGALDGEMNCASQKTVRDSDDESSVEQDSGDESSVEQDSGSTHGDGNRQTVELENECVKDEIDLEDESCFEDQDENEGESEGTSTNAESFLMYGSDDEVALSPLFQQVDILVDQFAQANTQLTKDQLKRYLGAHVCYEHHTKFIGEFKPPVISKSKLSGWSIYQKEHTKGKKILKSERKVFLQRLGAEWKALSAEQQQLYKLEAEEEKKRSAKLSMSAKYESFDRHWKQFRRCADFFRENYRTHLMIYRTTDTIYDKLYPPTFQPNSDESETAFKEIKAKLPTMSIMGFLEREMGKTRVTRQKTAQSAHIAHTAYTASPAPAEHAESAAEPAAELAKKTRRTRKVLKDSDEEDDSDGSYQEDDGSLIPQKRPALAISTLDDTPTIAGYFPAIAPLPENYSSRSLDVLLAALSSNRSVVSADVVQQASKRPRANKENYLKELRVIAKDAWSKAYGLTDEKKVAPSWKKVFTKKKCRDGHVYGLVGWPEDLPYPQSIRRGKVSFDIDSLTTSDAERVWKGFRDGVIDFERLD